VVYGTLNQIKRRLAIPTSNVVYDTEITDSQLTATREMDVDLSNQGVAVPLAGVSATISNYAGEVESDLAGAIMQEHKGESRPAEVLRARYKEGLMKLVKALTGGVYVTKGGIMEKGLERRTS